MEFNLLTFVFELINFLILVWLLKRILYKPVIQVLTKRREHIQSRLTAARSEEERLKELKAEYQSLLDEISERKKHKMAEMLAEVEQEKELRFQHIQSELEEERHKARLQLEHERDHLQAQLKAQAIQTALDFSSKFMQEILDPQLESKLLQLTLNTLEHLDESDCQQIQKELSERGEIRIETPFKANHEFSDKIIEFLQKKWGTEWEIGLHFKPELQAGMKIYLGSRLIDSSLSSYQERFAESLKHHAQH